MAYRRVPTGFVSTDGEQGDWRAAEERASAAEVAAALSISVEELETRVQQLTTALLNRPRIEHAVGMLMVLMSCGEDLAVAALKQVSQTTNRKLLQVADLLTASVGAGEPVPPDVRDALDLVLPPRRRRQDAPPPPSAGESPDPAAGAERLAEPAG